MKVKRWIIAGCAALAIGVLAETTSAQTSQVFRVEASLSGVVINTNGFAVNKYILNSADIINLARGRATTSAVPTNEVLGLVIQCGEEAPTSLIVFDKVLASCLVTAADINVEATFDYTESFVKGASKSHELRADAALDAHFGATGNGNNGWTSGILAFPARVDFRNSGPCAVQGISANKAVGNLKGISGGTHFAIVITKGTIVTSGQVGTLGP